jgi:hypothetical protein
MPRRPDSHLTVEQPARSARTYLLPDADPPKRIDDYIDYFGSGRTRSSTRAIDAGPRSAPQRALTAHNETTTRR